MSSWFRVFKNISSQVSSFLTRKCNILLLLFYLLPVFSSWYQSFCDRYQFCSPSNEKLGTSQITSWKSGSLFLVMVSVHPYVRNVHTYKTKQTIQIVKPLFQLVLWLVLGRGALLKIWNRWVRKIVPSELRHETVHISMLVTHSHEFSLCI